MWENSKFYTHIYDWNWSWHHLSKQKLILWPNQADGWQLMFSFLRKSRPYASSDTNQQDSMSKPGPSWVFPLHLFYLLSCCSSSRKIKWLDAFSLKNRKKILAATLLSTRGCAFLCWNRSAFSVHSSWCLPHQSSPAVLLVSLNLCTSPVHIISCRTVQKVLWSNMMLHWLLVLRKIDGTRELGTIKTLGLWHWTSPSWKPKQNTFLVVTRSTCLLSRSCNANLSISVHPAVNHTGHAALSLTLFQALTQVSESQQAGQWAVKRTDVHPSCSNEATNAAEWHSYSQRHQRWSMAKSYATKPYFNTVLKSIWTKPGPNWDKIRLDMIDS